MIKKILNKIKNLFSYKKHIKEFLVELEKKVDYIEDLLEKVGDKIEK